MKQLDEAQITLVGLGLMGGSLAGALRGTCRSVVGVARRQETISTALAWGLIDRGTTRLADGVREADIVVLATLVRVILQQIRELGPLLAEGCLLMDLGSTKTEIVAEMAKLPERIQPLGGHPMCGKETSGPEAAEPTLYRGATFILTPLPRTSERALALGRGLARAVGSRPLVVGAEPQDFLVGTVSHLPYLMACALVTPPGCPARRDSFFYGQRENGSPIPAPGTISSTCHPPLVGADPPERSSATRGRGAPPRPRGRCGGLDVLPATGLQALRRHLGPRFDQRSGRHHKGGLGGTVRPSGILTTQTLPPQRRVPRP